eukprot:scaffold8788_cov108-Isochrysis_galbana.AAC.11
MYITFNVLYVYVWLLVRVVIACRACEYASTSTSACVIQVLYLLALQASVQVTYKYTNDYEYASTRRARDARTRANATRHSTILWQTSITSPPFPPPPSPPPYPPPSPPPPSPPPPSPPPPSPPPPSPPPPSRLHLSPPLSAASLSAAALAAAALAAAALTSAALRRGGAAAGAGVTAIKKGGFASNASRPCRPRRCTSERRARSASCRWHRCGPCGGRAPGPPVDGDPGTWECSGGGGTYAREGQQVDARRHGRPLERLSRAPNAPARDVTYYLRCSRLL